MLSREDNELLRRVGRGTPMGSLIREHWMPALVSTDLPEAGGAPARVRLLGENLVDMPSEPAESDFKSKVRA